MRQTAGSRTLTAEAGTTRRRMAATSGTERTAAATGGVTRPSLANVPGRDKKAAGARGAVGGGGWAGYKKAREERSEKFPRLTVEDDPVIIRFAEHEPFAFIYRHWVKKRPYTCIADPEAKIECPLCEVGSKAKPVVFYNVITVSDAVLRVWEMSAEPTRQVQKQYDKLVAVDKRLDDPGLYFVVSKAKKDNGFYEYEMEKVRAADLAEETGAEPMDEAEIADALRRGLFTDEIIQVSTKSDLRDAAEGVEDTDD